jgi:uncharacterized protein
VYSIRWFERLRDLPQSAWDEMALPLKTPFLEWEWLNNLEISGSVTAETGWLPSHLTVWQGDELVGAAPLYVKGHSYGEFVFDNQWADLAQRMGIRYYPKLVGMTPITPAEGYRFLIAPSADEEAVTVLMLEAIDDFCQAHKLSGCHFLYADPDWKDKIADRGYTQWINQSYIWENNNYRSFDDYLADFNANQRRNIKRERNSVNSAGLFMETIAGDDITPDLCAQMYAFYADTCDKFGWWGSKYLTPKFFDLLYPKYRDRVVFAVAKDPQIDRPIGMSFCINKDDRLYGRYWGAQMEIDCLHFEACYYTPIEWAIDRHVQIFDPGAGGRHKKRRGFPARANYSLHRFYHRRFGQIITEYLHESNRVELADIELVNRDLPMKTLGSELRSKN